MKLKSLLASLAAAGLTAGLVACDNDDAAKSAAKPLDKGNGKGAKEETQNKAMSQKEIARRTEILANLTKIAHDTYSSDRCSDEEVLSVFSDEFEKAAARFVSLKASDEAFKQSGEKVKSGIQATTNKYCGVKVASFVAMDFMTLNGVEKVGVEKMSTLLVDRMEAVAKVLTEASKVHQEKIAKEMAFKNNLQDHKDLTASSNALLGNMDTLLGLISDKADGQCEMVEKTVGPGNTETVADCDGDKALGNAFALIPGYKNYITSAQKDMQSNSSIGSSVQAAGNGASLTEQVANLKDIESDITAKFTTLVGAATKAGITIDPRLNADLADAAKAVDEEQAKLITDRLAAYIIGDKMDKDNDPLIGIAYANLMLELRMKEANASKSEVCETGGRNCSEDKEPLHEDPEIAKYLEEMAEQWRLVAVYQQMYAMGYPAHASGAIQSSAEGILEAERARIADKVKETPEQKRQRQVEAASKVNQMPNGGAGIKLDQDAVKTLSGEPAEEASPGFRPGAAEFSAGQGAGVQISLEDAKAQAEAAQRDAEAKAKAEAPEWATRPAVLPRNEKGNFFGHANGANPTAEEVLENERTRISEKLVKTGQAGEEAAKKVVNPNGNQE